MTSRLQLFALIGKNDHFIIYFMFDFKQGSHRGCLLMYFMNDCLF